MKKRIPTIDFRRFEEKKIRGKNRSVCSLEHIWTDDGQIGIEVQLFEKIKDAQEALRKIVSELKKDAWGGVIKDDGNPCEGYRIEETPTSFTIFEVDNFPMSYESVNIRLRPINS